MKLFSFISIFISLIACRTDDQRLAHKDPQVFSAANPTPKFQALNQEHKVLVAVIDDGVDYNHPYLKDNIHYQIDENQQIKGFGYDYIGADQWPSPYLAMTAHLTDKARKNRISEVQNNIKAQKILNELHPELKHFYTPFRAHELESDNSTGHGTHVAGLITYDQPKIGILAYRILPFNEAWAKDDPSNNDFILLTKAIEQAISDGARVINMSLGITVEIDSRNYKRYVKNSEKFAELLNKHPDVLFVAAAGNDGRWVDGVARKTFPCGVENVKNMLCVGSLSKDFNFSTFSNLPVNHVPTVFTLGEDVLSTMPTNYCPEIDSYALGKVLSSENQTEAYHQEELTKLVDRINKNCVENRIDFKFLSGTSMATPLISRVAANLLIESPQLNAAQVINSVLDKAENYFDFKKLRLLKPSWYLNPDIINRVKKPSKYNQQKTGFEENFVKSDFPSPFFDFYIPKSSRL